MFLFCNVGSTGTGKSKFIADEFLNKNRKVFIYDFQNEYKNLPIYNGQKPIPNQCRFFGDFGVFEKLIRSLPKGYTIVIEEATGIFSGKTGQSFIQLILSKRHHSKNYVCNFHSMHRIPKNLAEFCDVLILRKTGDFGKDVKDKFPHLYKDWLELKSSSDKYEKRIYYLSNLTI